jgi:RHS repeat-associated protein
LAGKLRTGLTARSKDYDRAFAPFGEMYDNFGSSATLNFTGDTQDLWVGLFDTPNRELAPTQGRWISPDPAGTGWNLYAYVSNDPLDLTDPSGLWPHFVRHWNKAFGNGCSGPGSDGASSGCMPPWANPTYIVNGQQVPAYVAQGILSIGNGGFNSLTASWASFASTSSPSVASCDYGVVGDINACIDTCGDPITPDQLPTPVYGITGVTFADSGGDLVASNDPPISQLMKYIFNRPWAGGIQFPWLNKFVGPAFSGAVIDGKDSLTVCGGGGAGIGFRGASGGPLWGATANADKILRGASVSFSWNPFPLLGGQIITDGQHGFLYGPTYGTAGPPTLQGTYSGCKSGKVN